MSLGGCAASAAPLRGMGRGALKAREGWLGGGWWGWGGQIGWVVVNLGSVGEGRPVIPLILLKTWWVLLVVLVEPPCSALCLLSCPHSIKRHSMAHLKTGV